MFGVVRTALPKPDLIVGGVDRPYLSRWHLLHWSGGISFNLHRITRDDDDRALHDHVGWNVSIVLAGGYFEETPDWSAAPTTHTNIAFLPRLRRWRGPGRIIFRRATDAHRLALKDGRPAMTLWIRGPKRRRWGFHCEKGWVDADDFTAVHDRGQIGAGCGERNDPLPGDNYLQARAKQNAFQSYLEELEEEGYFNAAARRARRYDIHRWRTPEQAAAEAAQEAGKLVRLEPGMLYEPARESFQSRAWDWMKRCFTRADAHTPKQRSFRFVEESIELAQAMGTTREEVVQLADYVYGRPVGTAAQEIGGVMVTLAGVATAAGLELESCAEVELARCESKLEVIRAKDAAKPERAGALPGQAPGVVACYWRWEVVTDGRGHVCEKGWRRGCDGVMFHEKDAQRCTGCGRVVLEGTAACRE